MGGQNSVVVGATVGVRTCCDASKDGVSTDGAVVVVLVGVFGFGAAVVCSGIVLVAVRVVAEGVLVVVGSMAVVAVAVVVGSVVVVVVVVEGTGVGASVGAGVGAGVCTRTSSVVPVGKRALKVPSKVLVY